LPYAKNDRLAATIEFRQFFEAPAGCEICLNPDILRIQMSESFESSRAPEPVGAFPHAKRVGELLFLSGIGPRVRGSKEIPGVTLDPEGNIASYDIETQCRAVFENVRLVLEDTGATWQDIVDVTVFLTDMKKDFPIYNKLYAEYFAGPGKPNPTRTTIEVGALPTPIAIELKVIAAVG
jgi:2-aminomuconate deaminase